jgi:phage baseplate assembly protein W
MPQYIGFSTINANKPKTTNASAGVDGGFGSTVMPINTGRKYKLVDEQLVLQDFVNALNIQQGTKPGLPEYGTTIWSFVFEPNTADTQFQLENELRRVASLDPRLQLNYVKSFPQDQGILLEMEVAIAPFNQARTLNLFFDNLINKAVIK